MSDHTTHANHSHQHGSGCGHTAIRHSGHDDYVHEGHLHHVHGDHVDECQLAVSTGNPEACTPSHACGSHNPSHTHGSGCGHDAVPHGGHTDYLVQGHLHHSHSGHCDDHGVIQVV